MHQYQKRTVSHSPRTTPSSCEDGWKSRHEKRGKVIPGATEQSLLYSSPSVFGYSNVARRFSFLTGETRSDSAFIRALLNLHPHALVMDERSKFVQFQHMNGTLIHDNRFVMPEYSPLLDSCLSVQLCAGVQLPTFVPGLASDSNRERDSLRLSDSGHVEDWREVVASAKTLAYRIADAAPFGIAT